MVFSSIVLVLIVLFFGARLFFRKNTSNSLPVEEPQAVTTEEQHAEIIEESPTVPQTWEEYIKQDEFGDAVKKNKEDPRYTAVFEGTGKNSLNVNSFDVTMAIAFTDGIGYGNESKGERLIMILVLMAGSKNAQHKPQRLY